MQEHSTGKYYRSLTGKIIIALLLACIAVTLSLFITRVTFKKVLGTVNSLSEPNPRLQLVNRLFRDVVKLDQLQRTQTLTATTRQYNPYFKESKDIKLMLDTLQSISADDPRQVMLIDSMKGIIEQRDKIFLSYINMRTDFINNDTLAAQIKSLVEVNRAGDYNIDSSVVTTREKITTTTIEDVDTIVHAERPTFWDKLLGRKRSPEYLQRKRYIQEELKVQIDTLTTAKEDSFIVQLTRAIEQVETERAATRQQLVNRQMQLNRSGNLLVSQLVSTLHRLETEELKRSAGNNVQATTLVNESVRQMNWIMIGFIFCIALLAFMIFSDIVGSTRYRKELVLAKEKAEELGLVKQRFLANMSHELRTPLQSIIGIAEQVNGRGHAGKDEINIIYRSSQHLLQIVNQVLDYSHITSGKFRFEHKRFCVQDLAVEVRASMQVKAREKNLDFSFYSEASPLVEHIGDPFRLRQVLYNLLANAINYTDHGSVTFTIAEEERNDRTLFTFSISDTGIGIAEQDLDRIFSQFEQGTTTNGHHYHGSGLGLSIVKTLVQSQGGSISVVSTQDKGSEFTVVLPFTKAGPKVASTSTLPVENNHQAHVMVVDDDTYILQVCSLILSRHNIPHSCYSSASEALSCNRLSEFTIAFLDIRMPVMNGFQLLEHLRGRDNGKTIYYALTAQAMPDDLEQIKEQGFDGLLMKPFLEKELLNLLDQHSYSDTKLVWEPDYLHKMTLGDQSLMKSILREFINESRKDLAGYSKSLNLDLHHETAEYLHKLSGRFGQVGFRELGQELRKAEIMVRNSGSWGEEKNLLHQLAYEAQEKIAGLEHYIGVFDNETVAT